MTPSAALLHRIEQTPALAGALVCPSDFDITRRDPIDTLLIADGVPLHPMAGRDAGGTYYLCGPAGSGQRPVLYTDSEGRATLIGADLIEAITLVVVLPFWRDVQSEFTLDELKSELLEHHPDFEAERDRLLHALDLPALPEAEAATRLLTVAARTSPAYVPYVRDAGLHPYDLFFGEQPSGNTWRGA
ncbi:hypothetical protein [Streptomyces sp. SID4982]|uniref:hypothetical protein n=1 Tax=Streptomyces sp. SID4982 TaxID=2690291 RepID=UPI00136F6A86|nr:hypothetical protein [Streptomyces sp. SID4982]MYS14313.1 hypothetical protein [Streptomyces sp. SID4982]